VAIKLRNYAGLIVEVEPKLVQTELSALLEAVSASCGESGTAPSQENLRRARTALLKRLDEATRDGQLVDVNDPERGLLAYLKEVAP